jgi:hypothetical protein
MQSAVQEADKVVEREVVAELTDGQPDGGDAKSGANDAVTRLETETHVNARALGADSSAGNHQLRHLFGGPDR